jgi:hypothetical protein
MRNLIFLFVIILGISIIASNGWTFYCGTHLITRGDRKANVLLKCGEPTSKKQKCDKHHPETGVCIEKWEVWTYNCGDVDFFYQLTFDEDDTLIGISDRGRGKGKSQCKGKAE